MKSKILKYSIYSIGIIFMLSIPAACHFYTVSGSNPDSETKAKYKNLLNYRDEQFHNLKSVSVDWSSIPITEVIKDYFNKPETISPSKPIPSIKTDLTIGDYQSPTIIWFGHSSYMIKYKSLNILVDPVLSGYASPFSFFVNAYQGADVYKQEALPDIDLLIITHDHYDHLDYNTLSKLKGKIKKIITPLGVGSHLKYWEFDQNIITELNWYESTEISDSVKITSVPTQHFSGRSLSRNKTLWSAYALQLDTFKLFLACDGGYNSEYKKIGEKFGPFDVAMLENGQYNPKWHPIHCYPEETAQIGIDLRAKVIFPIHWAKFTLAFHPWNEPVKRLLIKADSLQIPVTVPQIGEPYSIGDTVKRNPWWDFD